MKNATNAAGKAAAKKKAEKSTAGEERHDPAGSAEQADHEVTEFEKRQSSDLVAPNLAHIDALEKAINYLLLAQNHVCEILFFYDDAGLYKELDEGWLKKELTFLVGDMDDIAVQICKTIERCKVSPSLSNT